jgi:hypothetical protein
MAATKITLAANPATGNLQLVFLNNAGMPQSFTQDAGGVWHGSGATSNAVVVANPAGTAFLAVQLVQDSGGLDLIALGADGLLRVQTLDQDDHWNPIGFQLLPNPGNIQYSSFSAAFCQDTGPIIAAIQKEVLTTYTIVGGQGHWRPPGLDGRPVQSTKVCAPKGATMFHHLVPPRRTIDGQVFACRTSFKTDTLQIRRTSAASCR